MTEAQTLASPTFNDVAIVGGVVGRQVGSGSSLGSIFSGHRTINAAPASPDSALSHAEINLDFSGGAGITESAVNAILNDFGNSGVGPNGSGWAATLSANISSIIPVGAKYTTDFPLQTACLKANPNGGLPPGATLRGCESHWDVAYGPNNRFASMTGTLTAQEYDWNANGVDDVGTWNPWQLLIGTHTDVRSGGWPLFIEQGMYVAPSNNASYVWLGDWMYYSGNFAHATLDLQTVSSATAKITSETPDIPVESVTVDNVMPLGGGDTTVFGLGGIGSTFGKIKTATAAVRTATTISVADTDYLRPGMFIYDITTGLSGISEGTTISSIISRTALLASKAVVVNDGDKLLFAQAKKRVMVDGHAYMVAGITLERSGSTAGTVYFASTVAGADAAHGMLIYPDSHAIWLCQGSSSAPWCDIAFNRSGSASLRSDGDAGILSTGPLTARGLTSAGNETVTGARADRSATVVTPTTGFSATIADNISRYIVNPPRPLANGRITMPVAPIPDQILRIDFTKAIASLDIRPNTGQKINGAPTSIGANTSIAFIFVGNTWIREQ